MKLVVILHVWLMIYSFVTVFSKKISIIHGVDIDSCILFSGIMLLIVAHAVIWQQIIKKIPLIVAYSNKSVSVIWGLLWGWLFFGEVISVRKIVGALLVVSGIIIYSYTDFGDVEIDK